MAENPSLEEEVTEPKGRFELLRSSVWDRQEEYACEMRTQRVTVVDEAGVQRVVLVAANWG